MVVKYDKESDVIYIQFSEKKVVESDEDKPGVILDYDENGEIIGIEVLNASKKNQSTQRYCLRSCIKSLDK